VVPLFSDLVKKVGTLQGKPFYERPRTSGLCNSGYGCGLEVPVYIF
jgi:hypothetical protein